MCEPQVQLRQGGAVYVWVKKLGAKTKYERANGGYLTPVDAVNFARYVTDNTKLASFVFVESKLKRRQKFDIKTPAEKFRSPKKTSKLPKRAKVEKRKYRIDKAGEKRDISVKGLRKLRSQKSVVKRVTGKKKPVKRKTKRKKK